MWVDTWEREIPRAEDRAQSVECLPQKCEDLSSTPSAPICMGMGVHICNLIVGEGWGLLTPV